MVTSISRSNNDIPNHPPYSFHSLYSAACVFLCNRTPQVLHHAGYYPENHNAPVSVFAGAPISSYAGSLYIILIRFWHSRSGITLIEQLKEHFQVHIPIVSLYEGPTIRAIAKLIGQDEAKQPMYEHRRSRGERRREKRRAAP